MSERRIRIETPALTRVEGEGRLDVDIRGDRIHRLHLDIFEPPRYFEKFLEGRHYSEVPDTVARICGICPVAYQMSAVQALESAFGIRPSPWVEAMRRVFYCGEWIQSHALHIHLLAAPDFLGFDDVMAMAREHPATVNRGLSLQGLGNALIALFGARSVHPVGARVGGFHHAPTPAEVAALVERLEAAIPEAEALVRWTAELPLPDEAQEFTSVALRHEREYPMVAGRIVSSAGLDVAAEAFDEHMQERHEPHSTALFAAIDGEPYLVGPLARLNLNRDRLPAAVAAVLSETGIGFPSANMYHSVVARAVEILFAVREARDLLAGYREPDSPWVAASPRAGDAAGATEAPRGLLWHRYRTDDAGLIRHARIVPPTSQNQARIEQDLHAALRAGGLDRPDDALRRHAETVIRNYDPCISCATHFIDLRVERGS